MSTIQENRAYADVIGIPATCPDWAVDRLLKRRPAFLAKNYPLDKIKVSKRGCSELPFEYRVAYRHAQALRALSTLRATRGGSLEELIASMRPANVDVENRSRLARLTRVVEADAPALRELDIDRTLYIGGAFARRELDRRAGYTGADFSAGPKIQNFALAIGVNADDRESHLKASTQHLAIANKSKTLERAQAHYSASEQHRFASQMADEAQSTRARNASRVANAIPESLVS